ncbi:hypothetical protein B0T24DRAFT_683683 [Lasiosphaeria ovina]|uniref:FAD dependent oxidoreductase domain-containing protein n=1 Tax=Lasiosphaeria ovina TaxID=92902 RepID=A0AAE0JW13_9PEZI|nr:hypothetical protein B0T24DRAFT_683683 [Lasiosphaeria ovina]
MIWSSGGALGHDGRPHSLEFFILVDTRRAVFDTNMVTSLEQRLDRSWGYYAKPVIQGTRPQRGRTTCRARNQTPCPGSRVIHAYAHGGAGWSLSIGSALQTAKLAGDALATLATLATVVPTAIKTATTPAAQLKRTVVV